MKKLVVLILCLAGLTTNMVGCAHRGIISGKHAEMCIRDRHVPLMEDSPVRPLKTM